MGQGFEDKIVRVTPFTNEELGLLIGTHKAQADKIVIRKKISHNELNELVRME